ncbi:hypothetical protein [Ramlibacter humi]|uniref:Uncharacterized protein n=1 Tax=Ramlibacter humi TaxID=2530451 RepID=A0A4Z0BBQ7_9BURK|nr:hypothetical protein [Ramlibacter humi]TFY96595.1 hypothetical protein EZ216_20290 [Ramlibacter humi]
MGIVLKGAALLAAVLLAGCAADTTARGAHWSPEPSMRPLLIFAADGQGHVIKVPAAGSPGAAATAARLHQGVVYLDSKKPGTQVAQTPVD